VLSERSDIYRALGEREQALACAQEALARYAPGIPGFSLSVYRWSVGRLLSEAGRHQEAGGYLQAVLDDPDSPRLDQVTANVWLAYNAVDDGRPAEAARAAARAVELAGLCGDDAMTTALDAQCFVLRRAKDWAGARVAAERHLAAARRAGGRARVYHALDSMAWTAAGSDDFALLRACCRSCPSWPGRWTRRRAFGGGRARWPAKGAIAGKRTGLKARPANAAGLGWHYLR